MDNHLVVKSRLFDLLRHLGHAGHHAHHTLHATHLLHLLQLGFQVVHVELTLLEAFHHPLGLFGLQGFLSALDQSYDVTHAEDTTGDPLRLKRLNGVHLLAKADEADRFAGDRTHG